MGNPEAKSIGDKIKKTPQYKKGEKVAIEFYKTHFDSKSVPTKELTRFNKFYYAALNRANKEIDSVSEKDAYRKSQLTTLKTKIEGVYAMLKIQIRLTIRDARESFVQEGALSYTSTDKNSIRAFFGRQGNKLEPKTGAYEHQKEFNNAIKLLVNRHLIDLKVLRNKIK
ncbi:hypothetical protein ACFL3T_05180 [Patescibacteria group bacterium]